MMTITIDSNSVISKSMFSHNKENYGYEKECHY